MTNLQNKNVEIIDITTILSQRFEKD